MYQILKLVSGEFVITDGDAANGLRVDTLSDMLRLRKRINDFVDYQEVDGVVDHGSPLSTVGEYINTIEAHKLAAARGYHIPSSTLISACGRGSILGARKEGGRWRMPRVAFEEWLDRWAAREDTDTE